MRASLPMSEWRKAVALLEKAADGLHSLDSSSVDYHSLAGELKELADKLREITSMKSKGER